MLYSTTKQEITGHDGLKYSMLSPLVRSPGRPANGWRVTLPVNGVNTTIEGNTPFEVYNATVVTLQRNGITLNVVDIWFNLNLQWVARCERYAVASVADLMSYAVTGEQVPQSPGLRNYKPGDWGSIAWNWLNLFLAKDTFNYNEFLLQLRYVWDMLNPATNPGIGCADCYREFSILFQTINNKPLTTQEEARRWLWETHNKVNARLGKPVISYAAAQKIAFWT